MCNFSRKNYGWFIQFLCLLKKTTTTTRIYTHTHRIRNVLQLPQSRAQTRQAEWIREANLCVFNREITAHTYGHARIWCNQVFFGYYFLSHYYYYKFFFLLLSSCMRKVHTQSVCVSFAAFPMAFMCPEFSSSRLVSVYTTTYDTTSIVTLSSSSSSLWPLLTTSNRDSVKDLLTCILYTYTTISAIKYFVCTRKILTSTCVMLLQTLWENGNFCRRKTRCNAIAVAIFWEGFFFTLYFFFCFLIWSYLSGLNIYILKWNQFSSLKNGTLVCLIICIASSLSLCVSYSRLLLLLLLVLWVCSRIS